MVINHNMSAMFARRVGSIIETGLVRNIEKLSSSIRINRAADDASGLAVSEKMRAQIRGLNKAGENIQNGVSFIQTTEGYLAETTSVLHRVRELAVQSSNGIYTDEDRMQIQVEVSQLIAEVDRIASSAQFNGMNMLTGRFAHNSATEVMALHVGANMNQRASIFIGDMSATSLGLYSGEGEKKEMLTLATASSANLAIGTIDNALMVVNKQRADLGAYQNRFETAYNGILIASENLQAAESRIRDADMAREMVEYTRNMILLETDAAMLAQGNAQPKAILRLLE